MRGHYREKVGRNDACPCGSGRKYKQCCLKQAEAEDELWVRVNAAFRRVQEELSELAGQQFGNLAEFAWSDYHFGDPGETLNEHTSDPSRSPSDLVPFMAYFICRWKPAGKKNLPSGDPSIAHAYLRMRGAGLSDLEKQIIELATSQPMTFHEVLSVVPGREFLLKEVFTGKESLVKERSGSRDVQPGDLLYGQLAPIANVTTMTFSAGFIIPPRMKPEMIMLRRELQDDEGGRALTRRDLLKYEEDIRELYLYIRDRLYAPPVLTNTDNEPLALQTIRYEVGSPQVAFDALARLAKGQSKEDLLEGATYDVDGSLLKITIPWLKKGNRRMKSWENTVLATIRISGRSLEADVNSVERAVRLRREIEKRLGLAAIYKGTEVVPVDVEKMRTRSAMPPARDEENELLKDPQVREKMREVLQKQVEAWVREKIPSLGGRTPLQAVKDRDGREMVEALVDDYERMAKKSFPESIRPDMSVLRRLLKLPEA